MFLGTKRVECPNCPKFINRRGQSFGPELEEVEGNWHGTGSDLGECTECGKIFIVHYEVARISEFG